MKNILLILAFSFVYFFPATVLGQSNELATMIIIFSDDVSNPNNDDSREHENPPYMIFTLTKVPADSVEKVMDLQAEISSVIKKIGKVKDTDDYDRVWSELLHPYSKKFQDVGVEEITVEFPRVSNKMYQLVKKGNPI